ncbi:DJ-1/PfpI family protein [Beijerinckia indica]|uniref:ThiJ/PfpI domain protein n=1 Tax=Beijerinckia indica subsp. indica (strain ATCC 9039 / DSM 1715 / NCIMB 8712) TaxID=395963 RepID=B2IIZ8_BEII9|nr:DJ-1/PfpI family protein [Beijerinckia indica]ACB96209.1 ThiJ/PfpI domain protein [Beijerinckia indica subsp. indica ATCC 9039]
MTDFSPREIVNKLHKYDDLPCYPKVNIHFLATAPGNEHLLKFMTEEPEDPNRFKGKRIGIIATHGVEETEISIPRKWFEERGATCHLVSPNHIEYGATFGIQFPEIAKTHVLAIQFTENSGWIPIDARIEEVSVEDYDAVYVPGGAWNPDQLRVNPAVLKYLQDFQSTGKPVGALCHGSQVFLSAKLLKGRKATGYWNIMEDMANAGAHVLDEPVVVDGNVITSRFIYDIPQFVKAIIDLLN